MTPWAYYALDSGNANSTSINNGYGCNSCPKKENQICPLNIMRVMEHISGCMAHFVGIINTRKNREDSTPPLNANIVSRIIQIDSARKITKMRRSPSNQRIVSVEENDELVILVKKLKNSTQILFISSLIHNINHHSTLRRTTENQG
jgi:hypothetical protein